MPEEPFFGEEDVVSRYTLRQAEEDGILVNLTQVGPEWAKSPLSHATTNLLTSKGYLTWPTPEEGKLNRPALNDLLFQAAQIMRRGYRKRRADWFYEGRVEFPDGSSGKIFIAQNETGKFTLMLPDDY
jgi:hypothetical protein